MRKRISIYVALAACLGLAIVLPLELMTREAHAAMEEASQPVELMTLEEALATEGARRLRIEVPSVAWGQKAPNWQTQTVSTPATRLSASANFQTADVSTERYARDVVRLKQRLR